jgi:chemosensory pili system protein ChpA (sensor histidine kinase/response regulator)
MLWVAVNVAEALRDGALPTMPALHQGFAGVLRAVRQIRQGVVPGAAPGQEPTRQLLYQVAHSTAAHPALEDLRKAFDLQAASPSQAEIEHARSSISGRNRALLDTVGGVVKEELMRVKDALDLQLRTNADIAGLAPQVAQLGSVADTLGMMGLGLARNVVLQQRESLAELVDGRRASDESALMDIAGALLYVDASLDDQVANLGETNAPDTQAVESQRTVEALAGEAIRNFAEARQQFVAFIETGWEHAQLQDMPRLLGEVGGALRMLELAEPADYVEGVRRYIGTELIERQRVPGGIQLDTLADAMASLEYYLEALREHRPNREEILGITRSSLEALRYWPLPSPVSEVSAPQLAAPAVAAPEATIAPAAELGIPAFEGHVDGEYAAPVVDEEIVLERGPELPAFVPAAESASAFDPVASEFDAVAADHPAQEEAELAEAAFGLLSDEIERADAPAFVASAPESASVASVPDAVSEAPTTIEASEGSGVAAVAEAPEAIEAPLADEAVQAAAFVAADTAAASDLPSLDGGFDLTGNDIDDEIRDVFLEEFDEEIDNLRQMLPAWTENVENLDKLRPIRRVFHTLKGSGRLVGARQLGEFAWKVENMLNRVLDGSRPATPAVVALLEQATETLPRLNQALRGATGVQADLAGIESVADRVAAGEEIFYSAPGLGAQAAPAADVEAAEPADEAAYVPDLQGTLASVDSVLREILEVEVATHLRTVDRWLEPAAAAQTAAATDPLLRAFHTMNGAFAMADVPEITEITGRAEQYIKRLIANDVPADAAGIAGLAAAVQAIRTAIAALQSAQPRIPLFAELRTQLSALRDALPQVARPVSTLVDDSSQHTYAGQRGQDVFIPEMPPPVDLTTAMDLSRFIDAPAELAPSLSTPPEASSPVSPAEDGPPTWFDIQQEYRTEPKWSQAPAPIAADAHLTLGQPASSDQDALDPDSLDAGTEAAEALEAHAMHDTGVDVEALSADALLPTAGDDADAPADASESERWDPAFADATVIADPSPASTDAPEIEAVAFEVTDADVTLTETEAAAEAMSLAERFETDESVAPVGNLPGEVFDRAAVQDADAAFEAQPADADAIDETVAADVDHASSQDAQAQTDLAASDPEDVQPSEAASLASEEALVSEQWHDADALTALDAAPSEQHDTDTDAVADAPSEDALAASPVEPDTVAVSGEDASDPAAIDHLSVAPEAEQAPPSAQDGLEDLPPAPEPTEVPAMAERMLDFTLFDRDLVDIFVEEGNDLLDHSDGLLARLRSAPDDRGLVIGLQRDLHTIKGGARMAGIEPIGDLGHAIESLLEQIAEHRADVDRGVIGLLERGFDVLHGMLARTAVYHMPIARPELVAEFDARARGELVGEPVAPVDDAIDENARGLDAPTAEARDAQALEASLDAAPEASLQDTPQGIEDIEALDIAASSDGTDATALEEEIPASGFVFAPEAVDASASPEIAFEIDAPTAGDAQSTEAREPFAFEAEAEDDADAAAQEQGQDLEEVTLPTVQGRPDASDDALDPAAAFAPAQDTTQGDDVSLPSDRFLDAGLLAALDAALGTSYGAEARDGKPASTAVSSVEVDSGSSKTWQRPASEGEVEATPVHEAGSAATPTIGSESAAVAWSAPALPPVPAFVPPVAATPVLVPQPIAELPPLSAPVDLQAAGDDEHSTLSTGQEQVRVRADLLDQLVNHAGEVAIYRARLEQQMGAFRAAMGELDRTNTRLHDQLRRLDLETEAQIVARYQREQDTRDTAFDPLELDRFSTLQQLSRALGESAADISGLQTVLDDLARQNDSLLGQQSRVSSELQDGLMRARMVPFEGSVPRLRRVLRQAAGDTGKQAQLQLEGAHGELDRNVLERMTAPLEHLLRNAVAHGLESPQARREAGKPEEGLVRVVLRREGSEMVLQVADDGAGIDHAAIRRRAEQRGMLPAGAELADIDLERLILEPGFSTAEEVSQLAGRGVGMDVVHNEVRQLGGSLEITSTRGQGTTFTLRLPQTLAVTQAVFVQIGETQFAVPVAAVGGVGRISRERFEALDAVYTYGGEEYALHDLGTLVGQGPAKAEGQPQVPLLLVRAGELRAAVAVDQVLGNREIVVKPVGPQIGSIPGIYGATITGDGSVVVILDAAPLVRRFIAQPALANTAAAPVEQRHVPLVMVVDDSLTMRKVTSRVLERHNFEVSTARDGVEALERLEERVPDLMLLDIEMPRMDGYELATAMKADPRFAGVPIVMITSRTGEKHRQRALEIGVQRYMGKPYQELDLMRNVYDLLGMARVRD